jgi:hypothetical protein
MSATCTCIHTPEVDAGVVLHASYCPAATADRLSPQREAEIATRDLIATRGPWGLYEDGTGRFDIAADLEETGHGYRCRRQIAQLDTEPIDNDPKHRDWNEAEDNEQVRIDAEFIAHAREDVPALLAELAAVRAERDEAQRKLDARTEDVAFLERATLPDLHRQIQHHQDGKKRWRDRAEKAEAEVTRMTLAEPELCSWCGHVEAAHSKDGSIDCNASGAEVAQMHQCPCTFFIPGGAA